MKNEWWSEPTGQMVRGGVMRACYRKVRPVSRLTTNALLDEVPNKPCPLKARLIFPKQNTIQYYKIEFSYAKYWTRSTQV